MTAEETDVWATDRSTLTPEGDVIDVVVVAADLQWALVCARVYTLLCRAGAALPVRLVLLGRWAVLPLVSGKIARVIQAYVIPIIRLDPRGRYPAYRMSAPEPTDLPVDPADPLRATGRTTKTVAAAVAAAADRDHVWLVAANRREVERLTRLVDEAAPPDVARRVRVIPRTAPELDWGTRTVRGSHEPVFFDHYAVKMRYQARGATP